MDRILKSILKTSTLLILFVCLAHLSFAQKIEFGEDFNNTGRLKNPGTEWTATAWPKSLVVMYHNGMTTINGNAMNFLIEPQAPLDMPPVDVKLVIGQARNWAALKYDFKAAGTYKVTAFDRVKNKLATGIITVNGPQKPEPKPEPVKEVAVVEKPKVEEVKAVVAPVKKAEVTKAAILENAPEPIFVESVVKEELTEEEKETLMFESFYIAFGRQVQSGMLTGQNEKFKAVPGGITTEVLFSNNEGFGTEIIAVDVWYKPEGGKAYDQHVTDMSVTIPKEARQSNFKLLLKERGSYKVSLYTGDADAIWIGSGYVSLY